MNALLTALYGGGSSLEVDETDLAACGVEICGEFLRVAARLPNLPSHRPTKDKSANLRTYSQQEAADAVGVSLRLVQDAAKLLRDAKSRPEIVEQVHLGELTINAALERCSSTTTISKSKPKDIAQYGNDNKRAGAANGKKAVDSNKPDR